MSGGYNLRFEQEVIAGNVPFIDSQHLRWIRGGVTLNSAQVHASIAASQGGAEVRNGRVWALAGAVIGIDGLGDIYTPTTPAVPASLQVGDVNDDTVINLVAGTPGAAGNDISFLFEDQMKGSPVAEVKVDGQQIKVVLANPTSAVAIDDTGAAVNDNLVEFVAKQGGVAGDGIEITLTAPAGDADLEISVNHTAREIAIQLETVGGVVQTTAVELVNACLANPRVMRLVDVRHGLDSDGSGDMAADVVTTAGGADGDTDDAANMANTIVAAINGYAEAAALIAAAAPVGTGNCVAGGDGIVDVATNLDGGLDAIAENVVGLRTVLLGADVDLGPVGDPQDAVATALDHGRVILARLPQPVEAAVLANFPEVSFV